MTILSGAALVFGINIVTSVLKNWVFPKFGAFGVQVVAFVLALLGAFWVIYAAEFPGLQDLALAGGAVFSMAVAFYEVVLKHISFFREGPSFGSGDIDG